MQYKFRIELQLNVNSIIKDGHYKPEDLYQRILNFANYLHLTRLKGKDDNTLLFGKSGKHKDDFSDCWLFQTGLLDCGWFKKYAKTLNWYNDFSDVSNHENVLDEYYN